MSYNLCVFKTIIRIAVFSTISLKITQYVIGGYHFDDAASIFWFVFAITVLYYFMLPLLALVSLPREGPGLLFMSFILVAVIGYVLTVFIPNFSVRPTTISELIIFGYVLPSKSLTLFWSNAFSSLLFTVMMMFFNWVCDCSKR